jgi:hypothetical protein
MRRTIGYALCAVTLFLWIWLPVVGAGEAKEKPAIEQILDILLQRGQITPEEYRSLQEKVKQEQAAGVKEPSATVLAGIEKGKPFLKSADDNFRLEFGGRLQVDFQGAEDWYQAPHGAIPWQSISHPSSPCRRGCHILQVDQGEDPIRAVRGRQPQGRLPRPDVYT